MKKETKSVLTFKKSSVAELDQTAMRNVVGGGTTVIEEQTTIICGDCIPVPGPIRTIIKLNA